MIALESNFYYLNPIAHKQMKTIEHYQFIERTPKQSLLDAMIAQSDDSSPHYGCRKVQGQDQWLYCNGYPHHT